MQLKENDMETGTGSDGVPNQAIEWLVVCGASYSVKPQPPTLQRRPKIYRHFSHACCSFPPPPQLSGRHSARRLVRMAEFPAS